MRVTHSRVIVDRRPVAEKFDEDEAGPDWLRSCGPRGSKGGLGVLHEPVAELFRTAGEVR